MKRSPLLIVGAVLAAFVLGVAVAALILRSGGSGDGASEPAAQVTAAPTVESTPSPSPTTEPSPTASPSPGPSATPAPRNVGGLLIVDEVWVGRVAEAGGLRIRSAPRLEPGNVVGSVTQGAEFTVEGRVLNGQEAEPGKGTVWLIVGPSQYIYAAEGYVERVR